MVFPRGQMESDNPEIRLDNEGRKVTAAAPESIEKEAEHSSSFFARGGEYLTTSIEGSHASKNERGKAGRLTSYPWYVIAQI